MTGAGTLGNRAQAVLDGNTLYQQRPAECGAIDNEWGAVWNVR